MILPMVMVDVFVVMEMDLIHQQIAINVTQLIMDQLVCLVLTLTAMAMDYVVVV
jgi:hypothetical protein